MENKNRLIVKKMIEVFGDKLLGSTSDDHSLTVALKDKTIVIDDYLEKTLEEIIDELKN